MATDPLFRTSDLLELAHLDLEAVPLKPVARQGQRVVFECEVSASRVAELRRSPEFALSLKVREALHRIRREADAFERAPYGGDGEHRHHPERRDRR